MGIPKVSDPSKIVTDPVVLDELARQGIDSNYVEFFEDYSTKYPTAKFYRDLKSGTRLGVFSGLPMVTPTGEKVVCGWTYHNDTYFSKVNTFTAQVTGNEITVDGTRWSPQLFLDGKEIQGKDAILLDIDPTNENYLQNVLEWDYGICKRRLRVIEGRIREKWIFSEDPEGEVRIQHNHTGKLKLGGVAVDDDTELVPADYFKNPEDGYPVIIGASPETFYGTTADGYVQMLDEAIYADAHDAATGEATTAGNDNICPVNYLAPGFYVYRGFLYFDTSGLPDTCVVTGAVLSIYGQGAAQQDEDDAGTADNCVFKGTQGAVLANADFDAFTGNMITAGNFSWEYPLAVDAYTAATLTDIDSDDFGYISKTGTTKFCVRTRGDKDNATPTGLNRDYFWSGDKGAGFYPKLVVTYTDPQLVTPGTLALTLTEFAPTVTVDYEAVPGVLALSLAAYAPTVLTPRLVTPSTLALSLTSYAPTVSTPRLVTPSTLALNLTTHAATVLTPRLVTPGTLVLSLTFYSPGIILGTIITPPALALVLTSYVPLMQYSEVVSRPGDGGADFAHGRRRRTHSEKLLTGNLDTYE